MKAMVLTQFNRPLIYESVPDPECGAYDAIIQVAGCGVCATDLKIVGGHVPNVPLPHIPGHEIAGVVVEVGRRIHDIRPGDHVCAHFYVPCTTCVYCKQGRTNLCSFLATGQLAGRIGFNRPGGYAQFVRIPARILVRVPEDVDLVTLSITADAIATAYHALRKRADLQPDQQVVLLGGVGGLGVHALQIAKRSATRVTVIDRGPGRRQIAMQFQADWFVDSDDEEAWQALLDHGRFADVVVDCVGNAALATKSFEFLRPGGRYVAVGYQYGGAVSLPYQTMVSMELESIGSRASTMVDFAEAVEQVVNGEITPCVTKRMPLAAANEALEAMRIGETMGRIVLIPEMEEMES